MDARICGHSEQCFLAVSVPTGSVAVQIQMKNSLVKVVFTQHCPSCRLHGLSRLADWV